MAKHHTSSRLSAVRDSKQGRSSPFDANAGWRCCQGNKGAGDSMCACESQGCQLFQTDQWSARVTDLVVREASKCGGTEQALRLAMEHRLLHSCTAAATS